MNEEHFFAFTADLLGGPQQQATEKELMALAASRLEELLQDLSAACEGRDAYDFGTCNLINDLRRAAAL